MYVPKKVFGKKDKEKPFGSVLELKQGPNAMLL
jgi:hypothetical protein